MYLKVLSPKVDLVTQLLGDDVDEASLVSILNLADDGETTPALIPIQIRIDNGDPVGEQSTIAVATGERVVIEKEYTDLLIVEDLDGAAITSGTVYASKIAYSCLLYTSPSPRDISGSRMPSSA